MNITLDAADLAFIGYILKQRIEEAQSKARVCYEIGDQYMHDVFLKQQSALFLLKAKFDGVTDPVYLDYLANKAPEPRD